MLIGVTAPQGNNSCSGFMCVYVRVCAGQRKVKTQKQQAVEEEDFLWTTCQTHRLGPISERVIRKGQLQLTKQISSRWKADSALFQSSVGFLRDPNFG